MKIELKLEFQSHHKMKIAGREIGDVEIVFLFIIIVLIFALPLGFVSSGTGNVKVVPVDSSGNVIGIKGMPVQTCFRIPCIKKYTNSQGYALFTNLPSPKNTNIKFKFTVNCPDCWGFSQENCYIHVEKDRTVTLNCKLSGSKPEDGEMKCTEVGSHKYDASIQKWQLVERCGDNEQCSCVSKFDCACTSFCVVGWKCKGTNIRGYQTSDCKWQSVSTCPSSTPYCLDGKCVECIGNSNCDDGLTYTEDRCVNNKCEHYGKPPTTTTITKTTTTITTTTIPIPTTTILPPTTIAPTPAPTLPVFCVSDAECDDQDPCTTDACINGECVNVFQDKDDDGVCDALDECPNVFGTQENAGCPAPAFPWVLVILGVGFLIVILVIALYMRR